MLMLVIVMNKNAQKYTFSFNAQENNGEKDGTEPRNTPFHVVINGIDTERELNGLPKTLVPANYRTPTLSVRFGSSWFDEAYRYIIIHTLR